MVDDLIEAEVTLEGTGEVIGAGFIELDHAVFDKTCGPDTFGVPDVFFGVELLIFIDSHLGYSFVCSSPDYLLTPKEGFRCQ